MKIIGNGVENHSRELEVGDTICSRGITATIKEIKYQDYWTELRNDGGFDTEFIDTCGVYRSWKQYIDGGNIIPKEKLDVPPDVITHVARYLKEEKLRYDLVKVVRASEYEADNYLYMVSAKKKSHDEEYAVWTCWNETTQSLNYGHYNINSLERCQEIFDEFYRKIKRVEY